MHRDRIDYWHRVLRIKTGVLIGKNAIKKLSIRLGEYSGHYLTALACLDKLKIAWKDYCAAKRVTWALRETFIQEKIDWQAEDRNTTSEHMENMLKREQRSIQEGIDSKQICRRNNKQPVLKAEITNFITGITRTVYMQEEIVVTAAESNLRCQSQTVGTAFRQPALFYALGPCADNKANCLGVLDGTFVPHKDADPFAVSLLETMVQPQSLKNKGLVNCIPTPANNTEA